jgi:alpha/beta superfamily hydrolase
VAALGAIPAADLAWREEPLGCPRRTPAARTMEFQFSAPEPHPLSWIESLMDRFTQSQATSEVAEPVAIACLPTPSQGGTREDRSGAGQPTRRLRGLPPSKT